MSDMPPFIARPHVLPWPLPDAPTLAVQLIEFTAEAFTPAAFAAHALALPAHIERSVRKRQAEYFHGRLAARHALAAAGLPVTDIGTGTGRQPLWPVGAIGSITHNGRRAGAVALPAGAWHGVGIDIESPATPEQLDSLASLAVSADELRLLGADRDALLPLVFSAKESFYKAAYGAVGRFFDFSAVRVTAIDTDRLTFIVAEPLSPHWAVGTPVQAHWRRLPDGDVLTAVIW
ncbi:4'-phosphopantetheinyl transferase superfamily protein [Pseudoduganella plicata]|uniref:Enterobactin synthase component D n=1 Tax=Pseudoduganella plicata TaxID=321984 RepID=A0ABX5S379_9BURK|nr:4'-phosphopantetheinyl transferase superfamily protein [Pseudoduganella plicata]